MTSARFKKVNIICCILFFAFLVLPFVTSFFGNKPKGKFVLIGGRKNFPMVYEQYYNRTYGLRDFFISSYYFVKIHVLGASPVSCFLKTQNYMVVAGKDNWLFYAPDFKSYSSIKDGLGVQDFEGKVTVSEDELEKIKINLEEQRDCLMKKNIPYLVVVVPNKQTAYPEFMPSWIDKGKISAQDRIMAYMKANSTVKLLDLRAPFDNLKKRYGDSLYYKTDTHWNPLGAFYAYSEVVKNITTDTASFPIHINDYTVSHRYTKGMDIARMVGVGDYYSDIDFDLKLKKNYDKKLPGLLIFRDSFYDLLEPYFKTTFDTITKTSTFALCDFKSLVEKSKCKIVIIELAERYEKAVLITPCYKNPGYINKK